VRAAVITVSDRCARGEMEDATGPEVRKRLEELGAEVAETVLVPDEKEQIRGALVRVSDQLRVDVAFTCGGTGLGPRDVTPEATEAVLERRAPGIAEAIRQASLAKTPNAMLSRAVSGLRGRTLIINLPGSPRGARECLEIVWPVLGHALEMMAGRGHGR